METMAISPPFDRIQRGGGVWKVNTSGHLVITDNTYDIGASGATRPRDIYLARNLTVGGTSTLSGALGITVQSATAFTVGRTGTTYALQVDTNTALSVTGIKITAAAAGGGLAITTISSGATENLTIDAKGSGTITLNATGTGGITLGRATTITTGGLTISGGGATITGGLTLSSGSQTISAGDFTITSGLLFIGTNSTGVFTRVGGYASVGTQYSSGAAVFGGNVRVTPSVNQMEIINANLGGQAIQMLINEPMTFHVLTGTIAAGAAFSAEKMRLSETALTLGTTSVPVNLTVGSTTGTKIGTATTQKLGFFNSTPIVQPASASQAAVGTTAATQTTPFGYTTAAQADAIVTLVNELRLQLVNLGLIKGSV